MCYAHFQMKYVNRVVHSMTYKVRCSNLDMKYHNRELL